MRRFPVLSPDRQPRLYQCAVCISHALNWWDCRARRSPEPMPVWLLQCHRGYWQVIGHGSVSPIVVSLFAEGKLITVFEHSRKVCLGTVITLHKTTIQLLAKQSHG